MANNFPVKIDSTIGECPYLCYSKPVGTIPDIKRYINIHFRFRPELFNTCPGQMFPHVATHTNFTPPYGLLWSR